MLFKSVMSIYNTNCVLFYLPVGQRRSSSVTKSTPANRFSLNSAIEFDSGRRPEIPLMTISSFPEYGEVPFTAPLLVCWLACGNLAGIVPSATKIFLMKFVIIE